MANELGIEHLKPVVKGIADIYEHGADALADKKVTFSEGLGFLSPLMAVVASFENKAEINAEFEDRTAEEIDELAAYALAESGEVNDPMRAKVKAILGLVAAGMQVQLAFKKPEAAEGGGTQ